MARPTLLTTGILTKVTLIPLFVKPGLYHDEPRPRVKVSVVDAFEDEAYEAEAEEDDDEGQPVLVELLDVGAERDGQQRHVLGDEDDVEEQLSHER